ncbi:MAG: hypothetical protein J6I42_06975, partial [Clostridia bacterium]|nr:hypothetical protein [Clostridia bacterium]
MKKSLIIALLLPLLILCTAVSCTQDTPTPDTAEPEIIEEAPETTEAPEVPEITEITETPEIPEEDPMEDIPDYDPIFVSEEEGLVSVFPGVSTAVYRGNYGFDEFLDQGGASTEAEILQFLMSMLNDPEGLRFSIDGLGCSTMQAPSKDGYYFG